MTDPGKSHSASPVILAVDDEPPVLNLIGVALRQAGYVVITAENGLRALDAAENAARIDLLITDVRMSRLNGLRLATLLRRSRPDIRVLFMSGYIDSLGSGANSDLAFLSKPFAIPSLLIMVRAILGEEGLSATV